MGNMAPMHVVQGALHEAQVSNTGTTTVVDTIPLPPDDHSYIESYEKLNKWKNPQIKTSTTTTTTTTTTTPTFERFVYQHNKSKASNAGFPSSLQIGTSQGLSTHEVSALYGWSTGDYRFLNPIARGGRQDSVVLFDDYPLLPQSFEKIQFLLTQEDVLPYIHILSAALQKLPPLTSTQILYRGHRRAIPHPKIGDAITFKGFTSVSRDYDNALSFASKLNEGTSTKRTLVVITSHVSGKCISKFSARREEMEVLFGLDTVFEIVKRPTTKEEGGEWERMEMAVENAKEEMRRGGMMDAEIEIVYVKEVVVACDTRRGDC